jgi:hypothetical protein
MMGACLENWNTLCHWIKDQVVKKYQADVSAPHAREIAINGL